MSRRTTLTCWGTKQVCSEAAQSATLRTYRVTNVQAQRENPKRSKCLKFSNFWNVLPCDPPSCQISAHTCTLFQTLPCSIDFWLRSWCLLCFAEVVVRTWYNAKQEQMTLVPWGSSIWVKKWGLTMLSRISGYRNSSKEPGRQVARLWKNGGNGTGKNGEIVPN